MGELKANRDTIDLVALLKTYWISFILTLSLSALVWMVLVEKLPKLYRSKVVMSIQPSYFQNPLAIGTDPHELSENKNQRELLLKKALSKDFFDELARSKGKNPKKESLKRRLEIYFINSMTFQLTFSAATPELAFAWVDGSTRQILKHLETSRRNMILSTQKAIEDTMNEMSPPGIRNSEPLKNQQTTEELEIYSHQRELHHLEAKAQLLSTIYSAHHPELKLMQGRIYELKTWLNTAQKNIPPSRLKNLSGTNSNLYEDLLRKWHYLNITLSVEGQNNNPQVLIIEPPVLDPYPFWPTYPSLAPICFGAGLGVFLLWIALNEFFLRKNPFLPPTGETPAP